MTTSEVDYKAFKLKCQEILDGDRPDDKKILEFLMQDTNIINLFLDAFSIKDETMTPTNVDMLLQAMNPKLFKARMAMVIMGILVALRDE